MCVCVCDLNHKKKREDNIEEGKMNFFLSKKWKYKFPFHIMFLWNYGFFFYMSFYYLSSSSSSIFFLISQIVTLFRFLLLFIQKFLCHISIFQCRFLLTFCFFFGKEKFDTFSVIVFFYIVLNKK